MHSAPYRLRRFLNWFPLALAYAFMYMGRYNLTVAKNALGDVLTKADFGQIFGIGAVVYGLSFIINGPLTDRVGGRRTMLIGTFGAVVANFLMGLVLYLNAQGNFAFPVAATFTVLYAINMYFQSFGAVAIVTVKAPWFHVRERGTFSTIFGIMIASGVYFAFDWGGSVVAATRGVLPAEIGFFGEFVRLIFSTGGTGIDQNWWIFFAPAFFLGVVWIVLLVFLCDRPSQAGFADFDTGEATVSGDGERLPATVIFRKLFQHPVLRIVCLIEFCSGVLRNGIMHWYTFFAKETGITDSFIVTRNWGLTLLLAGVAGSLLTGWASDRFFQSRRAPMAAILYAMMIVSTIAMTLGIAGNVWLVGTCAILISLGVIGVHGILSGTATVDFGGVKNGGAAVGIVDGLVYLGTAVQSLATGYLAPVGAAATDPANWRLWPAFLIPFALFGFYQSLQIWNASPRKMAT